MGETPDIQGEGNYEAGRRFQEEERRFVETAPVEQKAREAEEALDGPEGEALETARIETAKGAGHEVAGQEPSGDEA